MGKRIYLLSLLLVIFILSYLASATLPISEIFKGIAATPAIGALIAAVYQILKDHAAFQKQIELQQKNQEFTLGITSHMAQVAFDKHVEFCEKYMAELNCTTLTLFSEGPSEKAGEHAMKFFDLRSEYSTWITEEVSERLTQFERALKDIEVNTRRWKRTTKPEVWDRAYQNAEDTFDAVLGQLHDKEIPEDENVAIGAIQNRIREILANKHGASFG